MPVNYIKDGMLMQKLTSKFSKFSNTQLSSVNEYLFETNTVKTRVICLKKCNEFIECAVASYNRENRLCNLYFLPKNETVSSTNIDIYRKLNYTIYPCLYHCENHFLAKI